MADHHSKKSDPLIQLPYIERLEVEIKSQFYEPRNGKIWFSEEIKREHRRLKTSLFRYVLPSRLFVIMTAPFIYACFIALALLGLFVQRTRPFASLSTAYLRRSAGPNCDT